MSQSALLAGFAAGGVLLTLVPPRGALAVTATTFLVSALLLRLGTARRPARAAGGASGLSGTWAVLRNRRVRALMLMFWVPPLFAVVPEALAAPYADEIGVSTAALGLLMCALPVGTIAGELFAGSFLSAATRSRIVLPLAVTGVLPYLLYAPEPGVALAAVALLLAGATGAYTLGLDAWFVAAVPEEQREGHDPDDRGHDDRPGHRHGRGRDRGRVRPRARGRRGHRRPRHALPPRGRRRAAGDRKVETGLTGR
ncbi:hypothetical protein STANM309S_02276 [Streptomyces tanashiensis]